MWREQYAGACDHHSASIGRTSMSVPPEIVKKIEDGYNTLQVGWTFVWLFVCSSCADCRVKEPQRPRRCRMSAVWCVFACSFVFPTGLVLDLRGCSFELVGGELFFERDVVIDSWTAVARPS